ncbi:ATP-binding protein [Myxococcota bacterium]|nr:ATP-binding protein [Myxococcota bacterium]
MDPTWERRLEEFRRFGETSPIRTDLDDLLVDRMARVQRLLSAHTASVFLVDPEGRELVARASLGLEGEVARGLSIALGEGVEGRIAGSPGPVRLPDLEASGVPGATGRERRVRSLLGAPMRVAGRTVGVLHVGSVARREWSDADAWLIQLAAGRIAGEVEHARLHEAARSTLRQVSAAAERHRELVEGLDHTLVWEAEGPSLRVTYVSGRAVDLLGIPIEAWFEAEGLVGRVHPEDRARFEETVRECAEAGSDRHVDHRFVADAGSWRWFHTGIRCAASDGDGPRVRGISVDVTALKAAEESLRQSEDRFRRLVSWVEPYAIFGVDVEERISSWNTGVQRLFGYGEAEIVGMSFGKLYPEDAARRGVPAQDLARAREAGSHEAEGPRLRGDGTTFLARCVITALRGEDRELLGYSTVVQDVTADRRREERQRFLAQVTAEFVSTADAEEILPRLVEGAVPVLGDLCAAELSDGVGPGRIAVAHADPEVAEALRSAWGVRPPGPGPASAPAVLRAGAPALYEAAPEDLLAPPAPGGGAPSAARDLRPLSALVVPLAAHGRALGTLLVATTAASGRHLDEGDLAFAREVAGRAALALDNARLHREAEEANRRKDEFMAFLAHELRNPLGSISLALHVLDQLCGPDPRVVRHREIIGRQVRSLSRLVEDLLDVARITQGKMVLHRSRADLRDIVDHVLATHRPRAESRRQSLGARVGAEELAVDGDPVRLEQIAGNLVENAIKYTPEGGSVRVEARREGDEVVLRVADDGTGISADLLPRVFDIYSQARSGGTSRAGEGGLGLGLALVKRLAEMHGGRVAARSEGPGRGSEFEVRLPAAPPASRGD